jgi:hypothetical protein
MDRASNDVALLFVINCRSLIKLNKFEEGEIVERDKFMADILNS